LGETSTGKKDREHGNNKNSKNHFMKFATIIGARPQFIKTAALSRVLRQYAGVSEILVHTGQHFDDNMSRIFFEQMEIPRPDYNLEIAGLNHGAMTGRMLEKIEEVLLAEQPDTVLVYGDTNSTLAGALAGAKLHIPVAHVEAGLRSFNRQMPEEINRVLTDHVSSLLFAPTKPAVDNLHKEGIKKGVYLVGDVMYDAALFYAERAEVASDVLRQLCLAPKQYCLATIHRQENTENKKRLGSILEALAQSPLTIVFPLHPRTAKCIERFQLSIPRAIKVIEPVGYLDMVMLEKNASLIITDSGGVQKEAFFHQVPCITCRAETEWIELVEIGANQLIEPEELTDILATFHTQPDNQIPWHDNLYGDGHSAAKIIDILLRKTP
jgi:UDP-GlcNAc3NAcA epimerase